MELSGHLDNAANTCIKWAHNDLKMTWAVWPCRGNSTLFKYTCKKDPDPIVIGPGSIASSWELPLLALIAEGYINSSVVQNILKPDLLARWTHFLVKRSVFSSLQNYAHGITKVPKGYLVFFDGMSHVALSTGDTDANGNSEVVSFSSHSLLPGNYPVKGPVSGVPVVLTTIEKLRILMTLCETSAKPVVQVAKPVWA